LPLDGCDIKSGEFPETEDISWIFDIQDEAFYAKNAYLKIEGRCCAF